MNFFSGFLVLVVLIYILNFILKYIEFQRSTYKEKSGHYFFQTIFNTGLMGEYQIYLLLEKEGYSHILTNIYLPHPSKKISTTEIDVLAITEKGIFVFESKNYSGWIFGNENIRNWTQIIYNRKEKFYNPIMQNQTHIKALKLVLENLSDTVFKNYVVFSQRCELKKINIENKDIVLLKRTELIKKLREKNKLDENIFSKQEVDDIYMKLMKCTNVSNDIKEKHVKQIQKQINSD